MHRGISLNNLISSIENNIYNDSSNMVFINNHGDIVVSENNIKDVITNKDAYYVISHTFESSTMQEAYEPFMGWIRDIYREDFKDEVSEEEFLKECGVYPVQHEVFASYLKSGNCVRKEDMIIYEIEYEIDKMLLSIISILNRIAQKKPLFLVLNKLHLAGKSTISLLIKYIKANTSKNIALLATFNKIADIKAYMKPTWQEFTDLVETNKLDFDLGYFIGDDSRSTVRPFIPKVDNIGEYTRKLNNMLFLLALDQATDYLTAIYQKIEREKFNITSMEKFNILAIYTMVTLYKNDPSSALMMCKVMQAHIDLEKNKSSQFLYNYLVCLTQGELLQIEAAVENALCCIQLAKEMGNSYLVYKARILYVMTKTYGWKVADSNTNLSYEVKDLENELKKYGFENTLAYYYLNMCAISELDYKFEDITTVDYLKKTLQLANKLENNNLILYTYERMIVKCATDGKHHFVDELYHKYATLVKQFKVKYKNIVYKEFPYDGIGYNYVIRERYVQANEFFNESIRISYERKNPENIASTFYNKAINAIVAQEYAIADEYLSACFKIMSNIGITTIFQCNASKLYGLRALCSYYLDMEYKSYVNLNTIERLLLHIIDKSDQALCAMWDDDLFLYHFVKALLYRNENKLEESEQEFKKAYIHMNRSTSFMFCSYPMYALEIFELYCRMQKLEEGNVILRECIEFCDRNGYLIKKEQLENKLLGKKTIRTRYRLGMKKEEINKIIDMSRKVGNKIKYNIRQKEITFLSNWQDFLRKDRTTVKMFGKEAVSMLKDTFNFDGILYINVYDNKPKILYSDLSKKISDDELDYIYTFFKKRNNLLAVSRMDKMFNEYDGLINIFDKDRVHYLIGIPLINDNEIESILITFMNFNSVCKYRKALLTQHQLSIVKYAFYQLNNAMEKNNRRKEIRTINKNLRKLVVTDQLTGLYNRQGLTRMLNEYAKSDSKHAILYIDLDNFKYYNDTFGHYVGDKVLVLFANTLQRVLEKNDIAVRYGGDEFIIIKEMQEMDEVIDIAEQLIDIVKNDFLSEVMNAIGSNIAIPDDKRLSCSIGISRLNCDSKEKINDALRKADKALYIVKRRNKGGYELIPDEN